MKMVRDEKKDRREKQGLKKLVFRFFERSSENLQREKRKSLRKGLEIQSWIQ